jgi:3-deoxy-D-manno-octulosonate 8-phosphate phosphatase (KDO 8-P phosphatase)
LKVDFLVQRKGPKVAAVEEILAHTGCSWTEVCYVGDDWVDLGPLRRAGVGVAVADAAPEVRATARVVTQAAGGQGAVREIADWILEAQGKKAALVAEFAA